MIAWMLATLLGIQILRPAIQDTPLAITGATIVDGTGKAPLHNGVVVIRNGRFVAVGTRRQVHVPANARIVAARGKWLVPGLIDMHVHLDEVLTPGTFALYGVRVCAMSART